MTDRQDDAFSRQLEAALISAGGATGGHKQFRRLPECLGDNVLAQAIEERRGEGRCPRIHKQGRTGGGRGGWAQPWLQRPGDGGVQDLRGGSRASSRTTACRSGGLALPLQGNPGDSGEPRGGEGRPRELAESQRSTSPSSVVPPEKHTTNQARADAGAAPQTESGAGSERGPGRRPPSRRGWGREGHGQLELNCRAPRRASASAPAAEGRRGEGRGGEGKRGKRGRGGPELRTVSPASEQPPGARAPGRSGSGVWSSVASRGTAG